MNYKIWNKIDTINNTDAQYFIDSLKIRENDGVFLILDDLEEVQAVEIDRIIKSVYNLDQNLTTEQVAQEYIRIKEEEKLQAEKEQMTLEEQAKKISILQEQNANLLLDNAKKEIEINGLNKNLANVTLEIAKIKGGM